MLCQECAVVVRRKEHTGLCKVGMCSSFTCCYKEVETWGTEVAVQERISIGRVKFSLMTAPRPNLQSLAQLISVATCSPKITLPLKWLLGILLLDCLEFVPFQCRLAFALWIDCFGEIIISPLSDINYN